MDQGKRIKALREDAKMTQRELAERTGFSEEYVRLIETGHRHPKVAINKMLQVFGESADGAAVSIASEILRVAPRSSKEIEALAEANALQMFPQSVALAQPMPVTVAFRELGARLGLSVGIEVGVYQSGPEGQTWCDGAGGPIHCEVREDVFAAAERGSGPDRWTVAHEIAHAVLHHADLCERPGSMFRDINVMRPRDRAAANAFKVYESPEWQANRWAGAWLMPLPAIRIFLASQYALGAEVTPADLARHFLVSPQAAEIRLTTALPALAGPLEI